MFLTALHDFQSTVSKMLFVMLIKRRVHNQTCFPEIPLFSGGWQIFNRGFSGLVNRPPKCYSTHGCVANWHSWWLWASLLYKLKQMYIYKCIMIIVLDILDFAVNDLQHIFFCTILHFFKKNYEVVLSLNERKSKVFISKRKMSKYLNQF